MLSANSISSPMPSTPRPAVVGVGDCDTVLMRTCFSRP